jgi:integrase
LWKGTTYKDKTHPIKIKVYQDGKPIYFNTDYTCLTSEWDVKKHKVKNNDSVNLELETIKLRFSKEATAVGKGELTVNQLLTKKINRYLKNGQAGTHQKYTTILNQLEKFAGKNIKVGMITDDFIKDWQIFIGVQDVTMKSYAIKLGSVLPEQISKRIKGMKWTINTSKLMSLTDEQFKSLLKMEVDNGQIKDALYAFILQVYFNGLNIGNFLRLKWDNILTGYIDYKRIKTNKTGKFKIPDDAYPFLCYFANIIDNDKKKLLDYAYTNKDRFIFPTMNDGSINGVWDEMNIKGQYAKISAVTTVINRNLKIIRGIKSLPEMSTHTARATFALMAYKNSGGDIHMTSKAMAHGSVKQTENYIRNTQSAMDEFTDKVFGKKR